jgi:hypothetical protein
LQSTAQKPVELIPASGYPSVTQKSELSEQSLEVSHGEHSPPLDTPVVPPLVVVVTVEEELDELEELVPVVLPPVVLDELELEDEVVVAVVAVLVVLVVVVAGPPLEETLVGWQAHVEGLQTSSMVEQKSAAQSQPVVPVPPLLVEAVVVTAAELEVTTAELAMLDDPSVLTAADDVAAVLAAAELVLLDPPVVLP